MAAPEEVEAKSPNAKQKETSGLLMSIVRTLSSSADVSHREKEKTRLEKLYKESDRKLDQLVEGHLTDLTSIIQAFSKISSRITASQERIHAIKDNLQSCKNLLHCKRDELRKLWIEGIEYKTIVSVLDQIEEVKNVIDGLQSYIDKKQFLHAADLLVKSAAMLDGDLAHVEALNDVKGELLVKKQEMYEMLVDELHKQVYVKSTTSIIKGFQRQGSLRQSQRGDKISYLKLALKQAAQQAETETAAEEALKRLEEVKLDDIVAPQQITEDLNVDPEKDPVQYIAILVESLAMLKKMPEAIDALRSRIKTGLLAIIQRAAQQVSDTFYLEGEDMAQQFMPLYLLELLELVFRQFRIVARVHEIVLANMQRIKTTMSALGDFCLYSTSEVWAKIQEVLCDLLRDYLDVRSSGAAQTPGGVSFDEVTTDIGAFFAKKRPNRQKKYALFRFDSSSHAISMSSYMREQRQEVYGSEDMLRVTEGVTDVEQVPFVCKPCAANITVIYNPLQKFIKEVEICTRTPQGSLTLQTFVKDFIKRIYLGQVMDTIQSHIDQATEGFDAQRALIDLRTQRDLGVEKPLLQSTVVVASKIQELCTLMRDLPDYSDQFLNMTCKILQDYRETCQLLYRNLVTSVTGEKRTISATWARDEDINRLLRSLPNWGVLRSGGAEEEQQSEADMWAMNSKESSILTANLSSTDIFIPSQEVVMDPVILRALANLCQSLEWFAKCIEDLATSLSTGNLQVAFTATEDARGKNHPVPTVSENTLITLRSLAQDYIDQSETCLLVLHLEVRVHCFFYLIPLARQHNYCNVIDDMDPDSNVIKLNKDLSAVEETMHQSLQPPKFRYIFEGLGHLVSSILINSTQYFKRINENGVKKMCRNVFALQQCLTNITMNRETDLDHARQYYELLFLSAEEALKSIVERGPQFSEHEYTNLLSLAHRSERGAREGVLQERLHCLSDILQQSAL